jgi:hypothetical protein
MNTRTKLALAAAAVLAIVAAVWLPGRGTDAPSPTTGSRERDAPEGATPSLEPPTSANSPEPETPPPAPVRHDPELEEVVRVVEEAPSWRSASVSIAKLGELPPARGREIALALFGRMSDTFKRQKAFDDLILRVRVPWVLDLLDAMATDPDPAVRRAAYGHLRLVAFRRFSDEDDAYRGWREATRDRPAAEVWRRSLHSFVARLRETDDASFTGALASMTLRPDLVGIDEAAGARALEASGAVDLLLERLTRTGPGTISLAARQTGWSWLAKVRLGEERARRWFEPVLAQPEAFPPGTVDGVLEVLGGATGPWPKQALASVTTRELGQHHGGTLGAAWTRQLADSSTTIPLLIEVLGTEGIPAFNARLVAALLARATGASAGAGKDAAWWRTWWSENGDR